MNKPVDYTINVCGKLMDLSHPKVMGILNATPDSFYAGSRKQTEADIARRADSIMEEGGFIIDVGAYSTRPGAAVVTEEEEMARMRMALAAVRRCLWTHSVRRWHAWRLRSLVQALSMTCREEM